MAKNNFISPSKRKTKMISKFEKYKKLMQIAFLNSKHVHITQRQQVFQLVVKIQNCINKSKFVH